MDFRRSAAKFGDNKAGSKAKREELLNQVANDRAAREANRHKLKAALQIQRFYRGWKARSAVRQKLLASWLQKYNATAADITSCLPALQITGEMLPPMLQPIRCLQPPVAGWTWKPGIHGALNDGTTAAVLRGALALLLRSVASTSQDHNFCALCQHNQLRSQWLRQAHKLVVLCSGIVVMVQEERNAPATQISSKAASNQTLLMTAVARLVMVMTDVTAWKCFQSGTGSVLYATSQVPDQSGPHMQHDMQELRHHAGDTAAQQACAELSASKQIPHAITLALRHLISPILSIPQHKAPRFEPQAVTESSSVDQQQPQATSPGQQATVTEAASLAHVQNTTVINMMMHAAVRPLTAHVPISPAGTSNGSVHSMSSNPEAKAVSDFAAHGAAQMVEADHWAIAFAGNVLTVTGSVTHLSSTNRSQLTGLTPALRVLRALKQLAEATTGSRQTSGCASRTTAARTASNATGMGISVSDHSNVSVKQPTILLCAGLKGPVDAVLALGNVTQLLTGAASSTTEQAGNTRPLPGSSLLLEPALAQQLLQTANALLTFAVNHPELDQYAGQQCGAMSDAVGGLRPLAEGRVITKLLTSARLDSASARHTDSTTMSDSAVSEVAGLYHVLLLALPQWEKDSSQEQGQIKNGLTCALVSGLAFGCNILQTLWRWCAMNIGLPLEAPQGATRGWDVPSLRQGICGLQPYSALMLGLFCRVYAHALLVVDDNDFYQKQGMFTLAQQRAIATSLNALVFRTNCPATSEAKSTRMQHEASAGHSLHQPVKLLTDWAPIVLRGLYERNARRGYCPAALWLEPYKATELGTDFSAGAVARALAQGPTNAATICGSGSRPAAQAALLVTAPQCIPFDQRLLVFRALVAADKERGHWDKAPSEGGPQPLKLTVRRGSLLQDGWAALHNAGGLVKGRLVVSFVNEQGMLEAGLDYGGLVKEFLEQAIQSGFDANYGLFTSTPDGLAYPQPAATKVPNGLGLLEFLGLVVGKALYDGILLDVPLASFFIARLQGRRPMFDELAALDTELHRSLLQLKSYEGDAADLCLDFSIEDDTFGARTVHSLVPGGSQLAVTNENKLHYIHLAADWHLNGRPGASSAAFARGLSQVIPSSWLKMFNPHEVNELLGGGESGTLNVQDMAAHANYSGGYSKDDPTVKLFWKVLDSLTDEQHKAFMRFVTSCSRAPLGGFQHLNPPLTVHKVPAQASALAMLGGKDVDRLPSASTCYNMLKLPNYRRASTLKEKLLYAITSNTGFELS